MSNKEAEMKARERDVTDVRVEVLLDMVKASAEKVPPVYQKIEHGVVSGYKKLENAVVEGFGKVTDQCVEMLFAREGESVEDAKARKQA